MSGEIHAWTWYTGLELQLCLEEEEEAVTVKKTWGESSSRHKSLKERFGFWLRELDTETDVTLRSNLEPKGGDEELQPLQ